MPSGAGGIAIVAGSLLLAVVIGLRRGQLTRLSVEPGGQVMKQGTAVTIGLFLAIVITFALGTWAFVAHIDDREGFGAVMVMIALMLAVQAQIVFRRAERLCAGTRAANVVASSVARAEVGK